MEAFDMWTKLLFQRCQPCESHWDHLSGALGLQLGVGLLAVWVSNPGDFSVGCELNQEARAKQTHKSSPPLPRPCFHVMSLQVCFSLWSGDYSITQWEVWAGPHVPLTPPRPGQRTIWTPTWHFPTEVCTSDVQWIPTESWSEPWLRRSFRKWGSVFWAPCGFWWKLLQCGTRVKENREKRWVRSACPCEERGRWMNGKILYVLRVCEPMACLSVSQRSHSRRFRQNRFSCGVLSFAF